MAITNGYCTLAQLKAELGIATGDTDDDTVLEDSVEAASRAIDDWCGRRFYADGSDTTRYFTPTGRDAVHLHGAPTSVDLVSVTSVTVDLTGNGSYDETWVDGTDFVLGPRSASAEGWPFTRLQLLSSGSAVVPVGVPDSVKVVGTFGWSTTPEPVGRATIALASQIYKQLREAPFGQASFDLEGGVLRMSRYLPGNVEMMVRPYRRVSEYGYV